MSATITFKVNGTPTEFPASRVNPETGETESPVLYPGARALAGKDSGKQADEVVWMSARNFLAQERMASWG
jgi:hypothetical protein